MDRMIVRIRHQSCGIHRFCL